MRLKLCFDEELEISKEWQKVNSREVVDSHILGLQIFGHQCKVDENQKVSFLIRLMFHK